MTAVTFESFRGASPTPAPAAPPASPSSRADIDQLTFEQLFPTLPGTLSLAGAIGKASPRGLLALHRERARHFSDIAGWRISDLRRLRNVGARTAAEVVNALAAEAAQAEAHPANTRVANRGTEADLAGLQRTWAMSSAAATVAAWAVAFVDPGMTFADALATAEAADDLPADIAAAIRTVRDTPVAALAMNVSPVTPQDALREWFASLTERETEVLRRRSLASTPATLDAVGKELGVSAERVRTIEASILARAGDLFSPDWLPVGRLLDRLRTSSANLSPLELVAPPALGLHAIVPWLEIGDVDLLARLSGAATVEDGLLGWPDVASRLDEVRDAIGALIASGDDDVETVAELLEAMSVHGDPAAWVARCGYDVHGATVAPPPRSTADRAHRLLTDTSGPLSTEQIMTALELGIGPKSLRAAMDRDPRIIRVGPGYWAPAAPGRREFPGLRGAIGEALAEHGGGMPFNELLAALRAHYVVSSHSVRVYAGRPPHRTKDGYVTTDPTAAVEPADAADRD